MPVGVRDDGRPVCEHDGRLEQVVAGEAELAGQEADAAAERETGDADGRTRPGRDRAAVLRERRVDVDQPRAGADRRTPVGGERDRVQARDVDDHSRRRRIAAIAVPA